MASKELVCNLIIEYILVVCKYLLNRESYDVVSVVFAFHESFIFIFVKIYIEFVNKPSFQAP